MNKERVLFLCTGNSARSQMAEGLLRHLADDHYEVYSAGLEPKGINALAIQVMEEIGIDIREQESTSVREYLGKKVFTHVITLCDHAEENCPTTFLHQGKHLHWGFEDPAAKTGTTQEQLDLFRTIRDQIRDKLDVWIAEKV